MQPSSKKTVISYLLFSGLSTFLAFFLPVYLSGLLNQNAEMRFQIPFFAQLAVFDLFLFAMLYQGQYRLKTTVTDLGLKKAHLWKKLTGISFYISLLALLVLNIIMAGGMANSL